MQENRTRRGWAILVLLMMAAACGLAFSGLRPYLTEPRYQGKRLTEWLGDLDHQSQEVREQTIEALRLMGTNILPRLEEMMYAPDAVWRQKLAEISGQQPDSSLQVAPGFHQRWRAVRAMPAVGPEAVEPLIRALQHEDRLVRMGAALGLGELRERPDLTVPALVSSLQDGKSGIAIYAAEALAHFGEQARGAVPVLKEAMEATDAHVRARIARALKQIDPEADSLQADF